VVLEMSLDGRTCTLRVCFFYLARQQITGLEGLGILLKYTYEAIYHRHPLPSPKITPRRSCRRQCGTSHESVMN
jgi:hypothetical protein